MWIVTGTYNGRPTTIRWVDGDVFGEPTVPLPLTYADATSERFHFTYPDGMVTVSFADAFSTWAFTLRLLDNPVTTNPPAYPADWPARPVGRGNVA